MHTSNGKLVGKEGLLESEIVFALGGEKEWFEEVSEEAGKIL